MAEESPRPGSGEDSEAEEGDEEAAEAPVRAAVEAPVRQEEEDDDDDDDDGEDAAIPEEAELPPAPPTPPSRPGAPPSRPGAPPSRPGAPPSPPGTPPSPPSAPPSPPGVSSLPTLSRAPVLTTSPLPQAPRPPLLGDFPDSVQSFPRFYPNTRFYNNPPQYNPPAAVLPSPAAPAASSTSGVNHFANDGSFLELFKKQMESGGKEETKAEVEEPKPEKRKPVSFVGKRRGGAKLALKTGMVAKKPKSEDEEVLSRKGGAWAQYMAEVKKYKAHQCSDDDKTRPLVK
ncbi:telomerase RNA component interacting RNase isoform X1 [Mixophyes fleayi]|uniref:telomerase RNA component interacting RNase isoform X1 n=1 Tax=Mixophyes fleayi TaxID=3061075 RepID=UPI003F4D82B5